MGEVEDVDDAEDQGEPRRHEEEGHRGGEPAEQLRRYEVRVQGPFPGMMMAGPRIDGGRPRFLRLYFLTALRAASISSTEGMISSAL